MHPKSFTLGPARIFNEGLTSEDSLHLLPAPSGVSRFRRAFGFRQDAEARPLIALHGSAPAISRNPARFPGSIRPHPLRVRTLREPDKLVRVLKFAGTSLADAHCIERALEIICDWKREYSLVVVVSAMAGVSDLLIEAGRSAEAGDANTVSRIFADLREKHSCAADALIHSCSNRIEFDGQMQERFFQVERVFQESAQARKLAPAARDWISSFGERLCALLVAAALFEYNVAAETLDAGECLLPDCLPSQTNGCQPPRDASTTSVASLLRRRIIPVLTNSLGRNSDAPLSMLVSSQNSASLLGAALDNPKFIIWTHSDGFLTSHPRLPHESSAVPRIPKLTVDSALKSKCANVSLGLLVAQVARNGASDGLFAEMKSREHELCNLPEPRTVLESPSILSTRAAYRALGKDPTRYRGSAEALLRRVLSGKGLPQINPLVDIVNLVCVESRLPIGIYDLAQVKGEIVFREGRPGETYTGIGKVDLNLEGLSVLADEAGPLGSPTRDSERTMVTSATQQVTAVLISFGGMEGLESAGQRMSALLRKYAGGRHIHFEIMS